VDQHAWELTSKSLTDSATAYGSYGTDVTVVGGLPLIGYTAATARGVSYRLGAPEPIPTSPAADSQAHVDTACCTYNTGVGYDGHSHQAWTVWYENSGLRSTDGIDAQRLYPSLGTYVHAPGSTQANPVGSGYTSVQINHRIVVAPRVGGGLYVGYVEGYPSAGKVALWRVGASSALVRRVGGDVGSIGTAAGPRGRIWLYWWKEGTDTISVARSNPGVTQLGTACAIRTPLKTTEVWDMVGNASAGPLSLFIDAGDHPAIYSNLLKPCLSVAVSPHRVSHKRRSHVHVLVSDAGAPVRAAAVKFLGHKKSTNRRGRVTFTVPKGTKIGRYRIVVVRSGYHRALAHVRVR
jgi:hypothetical protein